jgi:predicted amidophosphoribosyltransferase
MKTLFNALCELLVGNDHPVCPICKNPGDLGESHNLKVCLRCQESFLEKIEFAGDVEVELCKSYCQN